MQSIRTATNTNLAALIMLGLTFMVGCASEGANNGPAAADTVGPKTDVESSLSLSPPPHPSSWRTISPGGQTLCSDGSDYRFFVRKGDPQKLMVYLQGGGACWMRQNCDPQMQPTYTINIPADFKPLALGAFNTDHPDNPFADYSVVYAPYCSADLSHCATFAQAQWPSQPICEETYTFKFLYYDTPLLCHPRYYATFCCSRRGS